MGMLRNCSGEINTMAASPSRTLSSASARSGIDRSPLIVTHEVIPCLSQSRHLVSHECDQRRYHHGQSARLVVAGQRRNLIAE